jgi:hypothetical protein
MNRRCAVDVVGAVDSARIVRDYRRERLAFRVEMAVYFPFLRGPGYQRGIVRETLKRWRRELDRICAP